MEIGDGEEVRTREPERIEDSEEFRNSGLHLDRLRSTVVAQVFVMNPTIFESCKLLVEHAAFFLTDRAMMISKTGEDTNALRGKHE